MEHYLKMLKKHARVDIEVLPEPKLSSALSPDEIKLRQAARFERAFGKGAVVALSDRGRSLDTPGFARWLERALAAAGGPLTFLIGGAYGLDDSLIKRADEQISLSPLTFSHQLVRLVLLEQLYRAFSLLSGGPYHK